MINFSEKLIKLCIKNKLTISLAESCTGGMIVSKLIAIPGASQVIESSLVTYSNKSKKIYLNVNIETLSKYGAVSKQVSEEMIYGLLIITYVAQIISLLQLKSEEQRMFSMALHVTINKQS